MPFGKGRIQSGLEANGTLWASGVAYELEDLIVEGPAVTIAIAPALNDACQIACSGYLKGEPVAIRLDPL